MTLLVSAQQLQSGQAYHLVHPRPLEAAVTVSTGLLDGRDDRAAAACRQRVCGVRYTHARR